MKLTSMRSTSPGIDVNPFWSPKGVNFDKEILREASSFGVLGVWGFGVQEYWKIWLMFEFAKARFRKYSVGLFAR